MNDSPEIKFIPPHPLKTAVLFMIFNRPDTTKQVFEAIREAKPPRLYIAADGARRDREGEAQKVEDARKIASNVDWDCEVKILFRDENLGCKYAVSGSITWFFEHEEQGIILEDDCLPSQSFFWFCEELLERYRGDLRVGHISGYNHFPNRVKYSDYFFSLFPGIWGWGTWKNRWKTYDVEISHFKNSEEELKSMFLDKRVFKYYSNIYSNIKLVDTWDYQWTYNLLMQRFLSIRPSYNLVTNIGFGKWATHTKSNNIAIMNNKGVELGVDNFKSPKWILPNIKEDKFFFKNRCCNSVYQRILRKMKNVYV